MSVTWRLRCLGEPCLLAEPSGGTRLALARKDAALLGYVGMNPGVPSARAAALLWPDAAASGAMNNLRQRLHRLRKATSARLLEVAETARLAGDLQLEAMPELPALEADPSAWDGQWLQGIEIDDAPEFASWLATERRTWIERRRDALAAIASAREQCGELARALGFAQRLLADDPLSEHAHRRLMRLHYRRGDTAAAVAAFDACERALKDELGLKPSAETQDLLRTIERGSLPAPLGPSPVPASLLRPPRAVGRDREREQLDEACREGWIAVLVGEAGMGKTRLLQDYCAALPRVAVYAQARPGDTTVPYGALARLLRAVVAAVPEAAAQAPRRELVRVVPEFGDAGVRGPAGQTVTLQQAIERLLGAASQHGGVTLVVDDLHFADRASIEMLRALVDAEALAGVRWAFAHRPAGAADEDGALLQSLADAPRARWIALAPLTDADLVALLDSLALPGIDPASFAPALARHTGGNPLYVLETLRATHALPGRAQGGAGPRLPRPETIAHLIDRRLQRLSKPALALARVAAIAVPDFSIGLAEHALGTPALALADAWHELEAADILRGEAFAHDLVHDAMLRLTPQPLMRHAHRQVAAYLDDHGGEPARVAVHWEQAGDSLPAANAWLAAAARANAALRMAEEAELLQRAATLLAAAGDAARHFETMNRIAGLRATLGHVEAAREAAQCMLDLVRDDAERLLALGAMMDAHAAGVEDEASLKVARQLIDLARHCGDERAELRGWRGLAAAHAYQGRYDEALDVHQQRAGWLAAQPAREDLLEWAIDQAYMLERTGQPEEAVASLAQTAQRALSGGYGRVAYEALTNQTMSTYRLGHLEQALAVAVSAERLALSGDAAVRPSAADEAMRGAIERDLGRFDDALRRLDVAIAQAHAEGATGWLSTTQDALALTYARLGQHHRAARLLNEALDDADLSLSTSRLITRAQAARCDPAPRDDMQAAVQAALATGLPERGRLYLLLEVLAGAGAEARLEVAAEAVDLAIRCGGPGFELHARLRWIDTQRRIGDPALAARECRSVLDALARRDAFGLYRPEALLICARALQPADESAARDVLEQAAQWIRAATRHVPKDFRESFLQRNAVNSDVLRRLSISGTASPSVDLGAGDMRRRDE